METERTPNPPKFDDVKAANPPTEYTVERAADMIALPRAFAESLNKRFRPHLGRQSRGGGGPGCITFPDEGRRSSNREPAWHAREKADTKSAVVSKAHRAFMRKLFAQFKSAARSALFLEKDAGQSSRRADLAKRHR